MQFENIVHRPLLAAGTAAALIAGTLFGGPALAAETTLSMVYPFPDFLVYTKSCKALVEQINSAGKGVVKIDLKPFNSIKMFQQPAAVTKGVVDMVCTPAAFYARTIPENEAVSTSNASPAQVRANGGMAIIDQLHQKHANMKYLGWIDSGVHFMIYSKNAPRFGANGLPDFKGVKLRDNPIYGAFFKAMGASTHPMPSTQVYSALEKGVINASAWTTIGLMALKWDKFLRHAVRPEFYTTDIGLVANNRKWNNLPGKAREIIQTNVLAWEAGSRALRMAEAKKELGQLADKGMTFHDVPKPKAFLKLAVDSAYQRMEERLKKMNRPLDSARKLRAAYQQ